MFGYKQLLEKTNIFNRRNMMTQLRHVSVINASNPVILKELSFAMFETYRYIVEKVLRSHKYRSFSDLLNSLFENHSYALNPETKKKKAGTRGRGKELRKKMRKGRTVSF